ncbi:hypothetical protein OIV83_005787 [Microbotryomycetes sp. JL201]|nr:hypothetical protein OIV83_005787 [Microbotryomycetes sp. JL201]
MQATPLCQASRECTRHFARRSAASRIGVRCLSAQAAAAASVDSATPSGSNIRQPVHASSSGSTLYSPTTDVMTQHVARLLGSVNLKLEPSVIQRALTHKSAINKTRPSSPQEVQDRLVGHGEKLAFIGRRVLRLHLAAYLSTALVHDSYAQATYLSDESLSRILETKELGANVGRVWGLERALRWREVRGPNGEMTGLYKSRGTAVEALLGAIYTQQGIEASTKTFNELVLPHLSLTSGLRRAIENIGSTEEQARLTA